MVDQLFPVVFDENCLILWSEIEENEANLKLLVGLDIKNK
jgi:hypothetical protein